MQLIRFFLSVLMINCTVFEADSAAIKDIDLYKFKLLCGADVEIQRTTRKSEESNLSRKCGFLRVYETLHPDGAIVVFGFLKNLPLGKYIIKINQESKETDPFNGEHEIFEHHGHEVNLGQFLVRSRSDEVPVYLNVARISLTSVLGRHLVIESLSGGWKGIGVIREKKKFPCP